MLRHFHSASSVQSDWLHWKKHAKFTTLARSIAVGFDSTAVETYEVGDEPEADAHAVMDSSSPRSIWVKMSKIDVSFSGGRPIPRSLTL